MHEQTQDPLLAAQQAAPVNDVDLAKFKDLCEQAWQKKQAHKALKDEMEERCAILHSEYQEFEREVLRFMEATRLDKFVSESCTLSRTSKEQVKIADKNLLLQHLTEKGDLLNVLRLNVTDVTRYYQEQIAIAESEGKFDIKIPGVSSPQTYYALSLRKR